ncbi:hypothetical protein WJ968_12465 [Achromobacter xylosoxidans]
MGVVDVDVGLAELAGGAGVAAIGDFAGGLAADDRGVVGAIDRDGDGTLGAVGGDDFEGLDQLLAYA